MARGSDHGTARGTARRWTRVAVPGWLAEIVDRAERVTTQVPCAEYFAIRDRAARVHATDLHWSTVPVRLRRAVWPTESFELVRSHVETTLPEDDLFAGISPE